jgi:hypothetical protein
MVTEPLPRWLKNWTTRSRKPIADFFASRVVFYPGSGTDGQPVQIFGSQHAAHCFVYADDGLDRNQVLTELGETGHPFMGYKTIGRIELFELDLTPNGWTRHVNPSPDFNNAHSNGQSYAFLDILERKPGFDHSHGPQRLALLTRCADGVAAYDALFCQAHAGASAPFAAVLQDHGYGGNYSRFGSGGYLDQLATTTQCFPEFLLVAENTAPWAGYSIVEEAADGRGGMHGFNRRLWRRTAQPVQPEARIQDWPNQASTQRHTVPAKNVHTAFEVPPKPPAQDLFFTGIENVTAALTLVEQVQALCAMAQVRVHYTYTSVADLRIEADRPAPNPRTQNVITMTWRKHLARFSCETFLSTQDCIEQGLPNRGARPIEPPLHCRVNVIPGIDDAAFLSIVRLSIQRFREQ